MTHDLTLNRRSGGCTTAYCHIFILLGDKFKRRYLNKQYKNMEKKRKKVQID